MDTNLHEFPGVRRYRKKPVIIESIRLNNENTMEAAKWCNGQRLPPNNYRGHEVAIHTLEGIMIAKSGDYIIKGVKGEFYPCRADIFEETYEAAHQE